MISNSYHRGDRTRNGRLHGVGVTRQSTQWGRTWPVATRHPIPHQVHPVSYLRSLIMTFLALQNFMRGRMMSTELPDSVYVFVRVVSLDA